MTREEAIEKIKKLQTLKEGASKVNSEGEMRNAATIIDKLQKQFGITMEEVYGSSSSASADGGRSDSERKDSCTEEPQSESEWNQQVNENLSTIRQNIDKALWRIVRENSEIADGDRKREIIRRAFDEYEYNLLSNEKIQEKCHKFDIHLSYCFDKEREVVESQLESSGFFESKYVRYGVRGNDDREEEPHKKKKLFNVNWMKFWAFAAFMIIIAIGKSLPDLNRQSRQEELEKNPIHRQYERESEEADKKIAEEGGAMWESKSASNNNVGDKKKTTSNYNNE
jgi:hypothetical protein